MTWKVEYWNGSSWVEKRAQLVEIVQTLNEHEEARFLIGNTEENRSWISTDKRVRLLWDGNVVFSGKMYGGKIKRDMIECVVYQEAYEILKRRVTGSQKFTNTPISNVLSWVLSGTGVVGNVTVSGSVSVRFEKANCFEAVKFLAESVNADFWADYDINGNPRINIGARTNSSPYPSLLPIEIPERGVDRAKKVDKVIVRGVDVDGNVIYGEAGSGDNVYVFTEKKAADVETLNKIAARKLAELNTENTSVVLPVKISDAYMLYPGCYVSVNILELSLSGNFRVMRIRKRLDRAEVEIIRAQYLERAFADLKKYEEYGIYVEIPSELEVKRITYKDATEPSWALNTRNIAMQDMADPNERVPTFHIDHSLWTRKDFFCQGFVGADSLYGVEMSANNYVAPELSSLGKLVYRGNEFIGFLGDFNNESRKWYLVLFKPVNIGDTLTIPVTGAQGTVIGTFIHTGGGAIQIGDAFTTPFDNPRIILSKSWTGRDVLEIINLQSFPAKLRLQELFFGKYDVIQLSSSGYVNCSSDDINKYVCYQARGWHGELKEYTLGKLVWYDNNSKKWKIEWIEGSGGQKPNVGTYIYVKNGSGAGYFESSDSDVKIYRYLNALKIQGDGLSIDGNLEVGQNILISQGSLFINNLPQSSASKIVVWDDSSKAFGWREATVTPHASTHLPGGSDQLFNQLLNTTNDVIFNSVKATSSVAGLKIGDSANTYGALSYDSSKVTLAALLSRNLYLTTDAGYKVYTDRTFDAASLMIGGVQVISSSRVLSNVTADASIITSGVFSPYRLGMGTPSSSTFLRGDGVWASISAHTHAFTDITSGGYSGIDIGVNSVHGVAGGVKVGGSYGSPDFVILSQTGYVALNVMASKNLYLGTPSTSYKVYTDRPFDAYSLLIGGTQVISQSRVLSNVTADASIITSGTFSQDRIPSPLSDSQASETALNVSANTWTDVFTVSRTFTTARKALIIAEATLYCSNYVTLYDINYVPFNYFDQSRTFECKILVDGSQPLGAWQRQSIEGFLTHVVVMAVVDLSAGSHTIKLQCYLGGTSGTIYQRRLDVVYL